MLTDGESAMILEKVSRTRRPLAAHGDTAATSMNLTVVVGLLKNTRMIIDTATSGAGAIDLAKTTSYDLILMDQRMPEMDGTETLHHIRELEGNLNRVTPVICLTADAVIGARERYIAEGFTDYLTKPIDSHVLERMLMKYLPGEKVMPVQKEEQTSHSDTGAALSDHEEISALQSCLIGLLLFLQQKRCPFPLPAVSSLPQSGKYHSQCHILHISQWM